MALILILDVSHVHENEKKDWVFLTAYIIAIVFLFVAVIFQKRILSSLARHVSLLLFESACIFCGAIYFWAKGTSLVAFSHGVLAGAIILFWIYLKKRIDGETIILSENHIVVPGLSGDRIIEWNELSNAIKKYDVLTFDFKNNKLLQVQVINEESINEDEFNLFCRYQLTANAPGKQNGIS
jgi:hypothetical protein